jgi:hypothetical protein
LLAGDVLLRQPKIHVVMIVRAVYRRRSSTSFGVLG